MDRIYTGVREERQIAGWEAKKFSGRYETNEETGLEWLNLEN